MKEMKITQNEAQQRLDRFLRKYLPDYKLGDIYKLFRNKKIKVNSKREKENYMLQLGDVIQLYIPVTEPALQEGAATPAKPVEVVYEDGNLLLVNKPFGVLTHPDQPGDRDTLIHRALYHLSQEEGYVPSPTFTPAACNRLDRNTGGIVIVAKNYSALKTVNKLIRQRSLRKLYLCVVKGVIGEAGEVKNFLLKDQEQNKVEILEQQEDGAKGVHTRYKPLATDGAYSLMEVELITGRSHQIRSHFASMGHPLVGDAKYGDHKTNQFFFDTFRLKHQFLYAYRLVFKESEEGLDYLKGKSFQSKLPDAFQAILQQLFDKRVKE
jgi:23S rRNA pseudouridine955/2504/2580 synthase